MQNSQFTLFLMCTLLISLWLMNGRREPIKRLYKAGVHPWFCWPSWPSAAHKFRRDGRCGTSADGVSAITRWGRSHSLQRPKLRDHAHGYCIMPKLATWTRFVRTVQYSWVGAAAGRSVKCSDAASTIGVPRAERIYSPDSGTEMEVDARIKDRRRADAVG